MGHDGQDDGRRVDRVGLGLTAADGFATGDLTSPFRAAARGALVDTTARTPVTELRIHGVAGSSGPTMLEHPVSVQVAGDGVAGFHRRWTPARQGGASVPWRLEAYSWGGLTEARLASASWILLTPFMLYNLAHFMLPGRDRAQHGGPRNRLHDLADAMLRLLALAATLQMIVAALGALLDTIALQAGRHSDRLPKAFQWLGAIPDGPRGALALVGVLLVVLALGVISTRTAQSYEAREPTIDDAATPEPAPAAEDAAREPTVDEPAEPEPAAGDRPLAWPMAEPAFWQGKNLVDRQWTAHLAAALGAVAVVGALPGLSQPWHRWCVVLGGVVVTGAVLATWSNWLNRYYVAHREARDRRDPERASTDTPWRRWLVIVVASAVAILTIGVTLHDGTWTRTTSMTAELDAVWFWLGAAQLLLLVVLVGTVGVLLITDPTRGGGTPEPKGASEGPYLRGFLAPVVVTLAVVLGGLLSAVVAIAAARPFGDPVPSGGDAAGIVIPRLLYAYAAAPLGLLVAAVALAVPLGRWFVLRRRTRRQQVPGEYGKRAATPLYARDRRRVATAWLLGDLADLAGAVVATVTASCAAVVLLTAKVIVVPGVSAFLGGGWAPSVGTVVALAIAAWLVALLRGAYASSAKRRGIGVVWDVGTFWPRATHPLAPPCYAERAVPEVVDRIGVLTGDRPADVEEVLTATDAPATSPDGLAVPVGPVLLAGYSQGSIIAPAAVAQLPAATRQKVALLTLACPARRLYGRAFPAFFGPGHLRTLKSDLSDDDLRWQNAFRRSDFIGSWIERKDPTGTAGELDVLCHDPVALVPDSRPTTSTIHRHSAWWPDPQVGTVAQRLVVLLCSRHAARTPMDEPGPPASDSDLGNGRRPQATRLS